MKKFISGLILCLVISIAGCSSKVVAPIVPDTLYGVVMENAFEGYYTMHQFDSICQADKIDSNLKNWYMVPLRDAETRENISQYMYIKALGDNEIIYRLQKINDNKFKITKRITK